MTLTLISPPSTEPIALDDIKNHLRLTSSDDDNEVTQLSVAARHALEARAGLAFLTQNWTYTVNDTQRGGFPGDIVLPLTPVKSVESVTRISHTGEFESVDPSQYSVQTGSIGRVIFRTPVSITPVIGCATEVTFTAGHDSASMIPAELRHAIRLLTAHFYENRESAGEARVFSIPRTIDALIAPYRRIAL